MNIYSRMVAGWGWIRKFTIWSPFNFQEDFDSLKTGVEQWGNYSVGSNIYPNLYNIFVDYSPTASALIHKKIKYLIGNIPKEQKQARTTYEVSYVNTLATQLKNICKDYIMFNGSFAIWVGYDNEGRVNEFKQIPIEQIRYVRRDENLYKATDSRYMIAITKEGYEIKGLYYPFEKGRVQEQQGKYEAGTQLCEGQILFYNTSNTSLYPDCIFDAYVPLLLTDAGLDTMIMSVLGNSDLMKTYAKRSGTRGTDAVNNMFKEITSIWAIQGNKSATAYMADEGSEFIQTGVKSAGQKTYIDIDTDEAVSNYVTILDFPKFIDDTIKIDERTARKLCIPLGMPYEFAYKMDSGILNQDNRETMLKEINATFEDDREIIESTINDILEDSNFDFRLEIKAIGEDKEELKEANDNITE